MDQEIVRKCMMPWHKTPTKCSIIKVTNTSAIVSRKKFKKKVKISHNLLAVGQLLSGHRHNIEMQSNKHSVIPLSRLLRPHLTEKSNFQDHLGELIQSTVLEVNSPRSRS